MFFQAAGIEVDPWIPPLVALGISFFTSMGGVSGAFLLLPFQMSFLGYTNPSVSATNQLYNIVAIPSGVYRYWKEGRMLWPLTWVVVAGTLPGVFIGAFVRVAYLPNPQNFKLFAAGVLLYIGAKMVRDLVKKKSAGADNKASSEERFQEMVRRHRSQAAGKEQAAGSLSAVKVTHFNLQRLGYSFYGEKFDVSFLGIFSLSFIVGIVGGIYGIGGGAIIAPFFVTVFGLPVYTVAGAALIAAGDDVGRRAVTGAEHGIGRPGADVLKAGDGVDERAVLGPASLEVRDGHLGPKVSAGRGQLLAGHRLRGVERVGGRRVERGHRDRQHDQHHHHEQQDVPAGGALALHFITCEKLRNM